MKPLFFAALLACSDLALGEAIIPQPFDAARYGDSLAKSPFVLATPINPPPIPDGPGPFKDLYLRAVSKGLDGRYFILVQRLGDEKAIRLEGTDPNEDGFMIKNVKVGDGFRTTRVTLQKGSNEGEIGFKEDSIASAPAPGGTRPRFPGGPISIRPPSAPAPTPAPAPNSGIPKPPNAGPDILQQLVPPTPVTNPGTRTFGRNRPIRP